MALKYALDYQALQTTFPDGYIRIIRVEFLNELRRVHADVAFFANQASSNAAKNGNGRELEMIRFSFDLPENEVNPFAYIYEQLKLMPEFEGAEDV